MNYKSILMGVVLWSALSISSLSAESSLQIYLKEHAEAFKALEPHIPSIIVAVERTKEGNYYDYEYTTPAAKKAHEQYVKAWGNLGRVCFVHLLGKGFAVGFTLAVINKLFCTEINDRKVVAVAILVSLAAIVQRNYQLGSITTYTSAFKGYNRLGKISTALDFFVTLAAAAVGYYGMQSVFTTFLDT